MTRMVPFKYVGFFDVPRYIVLGYRGQLLFLRSEFDEELDDYESNYSVFILPESVWDSVQDGNWEFYDKTAMTEIGRIPVSAISFGESKRTELDASCLDDLITRFGADD